MNLVIQNGGGIFVRTLLLHSSMHIIFQFPIVDFRPLLNSVEKLPYPEWPDIGMSSQRFIRRFGAVQQRKAGGNEYWSGEGYYCNAHLVMQYDNLHHKGFELVPGIKTAIFNAYRRYSSAENFLGRMEAGFVDNAEGLIYRHQLPSNSVKLEAILRHYCNMPVTVDGKQFKLSRIGQRLADNYYLQSTPVKVIPQARNKSVKAGDVVILLVYSTSNAFKLPHYSFKIEEIELPGETVKLKLHGYKLRHENLSYKVWLIELPSRMTDLTKPAKAVLRNLRINLLRIHLEKETIRILLNGIKSKEILMDPDSAQAQLANAYFEQTGQKIFQKTRYSIQQQKLLDFALYSENSADPGSFVQLEEGIYNFKNKYVRNNIERLLTRMAKKKILLICTSPRDSNPTAFDDEYKRIKNALRASTDRDNFEIEIETSVKKAEFFDLLNHHKPHFLHLCMHTTLQDGLYFEDEHKEVFPMPVAEFADIIKLFSEEVLKPTCILLSACNSKAHAEAVTAYCDFAIGTQRVFPASAGIVYAAGFYQTLFENNLSNIPYCHKGGIQAIKSCKEDFGTYDIPVYDIPVLIY